MGDPVVKSFSLSALTAADPTARADPYARLKELRALCPVHHDAAAGGWVVPRMTDARAVLSDSSHYKNPDRAEPGAHAIKRRRATVPDGVSHPNDQRSSMLDLDGAEHARVRGPLWRPCWRALRASSRNAFVLSM